jgi:hypothetical protein
VRSFSSVRETRPIEAVTGVGDWTQTPLCVRYAELLRLRQAVLKIDSELAKSSRDRIDLKHV